MADSGTLESLDASQQKEKLVKKEAVEDVDEDGSSEDDSSEEEENDEDNHYEEDGFVVETVEEDEVERHKKRPKLRRLENKSKKSRKRKHKLTEDDLEVIRGENQTHDEYGRPYKRVKLNPSDDSESEDDIILPEQQERETYRDHEAASVGSIGSEDSFVEGRGGHAQAMEGLDDRLNEIATLFDSSKYQQNEEDMDFEPVQHQEEKGQYEHYISQGYAPSDLAEMYLTNEDDIIRNTDKPERMQEMFPKRVIPTARELTDEAIWVVNQFIAEDRAIASNRELVLNTVENLLRLFLVDNLEMMFIISFRKDTWKDILEVKWLWRLLDLDEEWFRLTNKRKLIKDISEANQAVIPTEFFDLLTLAVSDDFLNDCQDHFSIIYGELVSLKSVNTKYSELKKTRCAQLAAEFGLKAGEIAENISNGYPVNMTRDHESMPLEAAASFGDSWDEPEVLLNNATYVLATELACNPHFRKVVRERFFEYGLARISKINPEKNLDRHHAYERVAGNEYRINNITGDQWSLVCAAAKEGMLTKELLLPYDQFAGELTPNFSSMRLGPVSTSWNQLRARVIKEAFEMARRVVARQVEKKLKQDADAYVTNLCLERLAEQLIVGAKARPENGGECVMACSEQGDELCFVILTLEGELKAHLEIPSRERIDKQNQDKIRNLYDTHKPYICGVALDNYQIWSKALKDFRFLIKLDECYVTFVEPRVAHLYHLSKRAIKEFPKHSPNLRRAVSIGRRLIDPMMEICGLCTYDKDIRHLGLHPLASFVDPSYFMKRIYRLLNQQVSSVGVDLNRIADHKWMQYQLQFLPGLGPRKATDLINKVVNAGSFVSSRESLEELLSPRVYENCAGFIKIVNYGGSKDLYPSEILDFMRIHPNDYLFVKHLAAEIMNKPEETKKIVQKLMKDAAMVEGIPLDQLSAKYPTKHYLLIDIKNELNNPFHDYRIFTNMTASRLFDLIAGENLQVGQLATVTVMSVRPMEHTNPELVVELESGLEGVIPFGYLSLSQQADVPNHPGEIMKRMQRAYPRMSVMFALVTDLVKEMQPRVILSEIEAKNLLQAEMLEQDMGPGQVARAKVDVHGRNPHQFITRGIMHFLFQNISSSQARAELKDKEFGAFIVHPSNKAKELIVTLKLFGGLFVHLPILDPHENGKSLQVEGQTFENLDDLVTNYVDLIAMYATDMTQFRHYAEKKPEEVKQMCEARIVAQPKAIPYFVAPDYKHPGFLMLFYMPGSRMRKESVRLTPQGFKMAGQYFTSPDKLVDWFKQNMKTLEKRPSTTTQPQQPYMQQPFMYGQQPYGVPQHYMYQGYPATSYGQPQ